MNKASLNFNAIHMESDTSLLKGIRGAEYVDERLVKGEILVA